MPVTYAQLFMGPASFSNHKISLIALPISGGREHRNGGAAFGRPEHQHYILAHFQCVKVAVHDIRQYCWAFLQRHISDGIWLGRSPHHTEGIYSAFARGWLPLCLVTEAEGAYRARIPVGSAAGSTFLKDEPALDRRIPEWLGF
jgi:hypothetical protein